MRSGGPNFLGAAYSPLVVPGDPNSDSFQVKDVALPKGVDDARLDGRRKLLSQLDRFQRVAENPSDPVRSLDSYAEKAYSLVTSPGAKAAFDVKKEDPKLRESYGRNNIGQQFLLARRLVEAGVRLVTVMTGRRIDQAWDTHRDHFGLMRTALCPPFDRAFSALISYLHTRGLLEETLVVVMGEFGRTPKIGQVTSGAGAAKGNGRDHWPYCYTVLFAGAGTPGGAVYGSSDKTAAYPRENPVTPEDIAATIYTALGIPLDLELRDGQDKPYVLCTGKPISALLR
jgi:uncharacterized protein (DUF1501 family)